MTVSDSPPVLRVPAVWGNVPQRNKNFTGRQEILERLRQGVSSTVTAVLPHALQGMGGVGKTAVAIEYAYRYRPEYDLVWWIPADQPVLVRSSLAALAPPLGLQAASASGIEAAASAVLDALRTGKPFNRWLLIFDNADQPEDLNEVIPWASGHVLITSRNHRWQSVVDTVTVDVFSRSESTAFLGKRVPKGLSESEASRLAEELGDLPLALEQAGALQAETGMSAEEYLQLLQGHAAEIMAEGRSPEYPQSMTAAWRLSVATLSQTLPQAMELLRCCAFFGPEPIPRDLFRRVPQAAPTRMGGLLNNPILLARAISELGRFALIRIDGRTIIVHRLIQALLREELNPADQDRYQHEVHLILATGAPTNPDDIRLWPRFAELVAHVSSEVTDLARCSSPRPRDLGIHVVRYLGQSGDHQSARTLAEAFISRWTLDSGPDDPQVLAMQRNLGDALRELGLYAESYDLTDGTLARARAALGDRDPLTLALTNSLAADLRARGDFASARAVDEKSLALHENVLGAEDPLTLRVTNNLALDYGLTSNYARARDLHERAYLMQSQAQTGVSISDLLNTWNCLARAVRLCGFFAEAAAVGEDAYGYGREQLGPEHYLTLRAAKDLSIALRRRRTDDDYALEFAQVVFDHYRRLFPGRPDTLAAAIGLINVRRVLGQSEKVVALAEDTVTQYAQVYGSEHPYTYGCMGDLALLLRMTGDTARARELDQRALDGLDARLTRNHDYSLTVAMNLASDLVAMGDVTAARQLGEDTLERLRNVMGADYNLTLAGAINLAADLRADGLCERADALREDIRLHYEHGLGTDYPDASALDDGRRLNFDFDPPPI
jgi:Tetratricopeptide repeat/NB-ARC domain